MVRKAFVLASLVLFSLVSISLASSSMLINTSTQTGYYLNASYSNLINFSVHPMSEEVTSVQIAILGVSLLPSTNGTSASVNSSIYTNSTSQVFIWKNLTGNPLISNNTVRYFWMNLVPSNSGTIIIQVNATSSTASDENTTNLNFVSNFEFSGYVKNDSGDLANATSVFIYQFIQSSNGPPTEIATASANSSADGSFTIKSINGSAQMYKIKMIQYNSSGTAIKIGSVLPPFPSNMYFPLSPDPTKKAFMKAPNLNGTTFYTQPAATLNIFEISGKRFGYEIVDKKLGFPVESNVRNSVANVNITIPAGRDYNIMIVRDFSQFVFSQTVCNTTDNFANVSTCPFPPKSNSTLPTLNAGDVVQVTLNLNISERRMYGCLAVSGNTSAIINITRIVPKMVPWQGFVPSMKAEIGQINLADQATFNISDPKCSGKWAFYNISMMNADYLVEFYAMNYSVNNNTASYLGAFQNVSINSSTDAYVNLTLVALAGVWPSGIGLGELNVTKMKINIQNSSGAAMTNQMQANVKVKHPVFGTLNYMIDSSSMENGSFYLPILAGSSWAKVMAFPNEAPPIERTLNLTISENNITLPSGELGFRKMLANGTLIQTNVSDSTIEMRFLRNSVACNINEPPSSCSLTSMNAENFNPLVAMVAGKVNLEMKLVASNKKDNVTITYWNFDMFSAKPPTNSMMNENASSSSSTQQIWQFGAFAPSDAYDNVTIAMPYSGTSSDTNYYNESWDFNVTIPTLYKENSHTQGQFEVAWNGSAGYTSENLTDDFLEYNRSSFRDYLTAGGVACSKTDSSSICHMNTTVKRIYIKIPHFSGVSPSSSGTAPAASASSTANTGGSSSSPASYWTRDYSISDSQLTSGYSQGLEVKARVRFSIFTQEHSVGVIALSNTTATINISSDPQTATLAIGEEKKFDLTSDNYYDISVKLLGIANSQANLTIKKISEKMPETSNSQTAGTGSEAETTQETSASLKSIQLWVIVIIIIVVIVLVIAYLVSRKRR